MSGLLKIIGIGVTGLFAVQFASRFRTLMAQQAGSAAKSQVAQLAVLKSVHPSQDLLANLNKYTVIDVRELNERQQPMGNVPTSAHIPLATVLDGSARIPAAQDHPLLVVCRSGARSARAGQNLLERGWKDVTNLEGGTMGWAAAGLPTEPHKEKE